MNVVIISGLFHTKDNYEVDLKIHINLNFPVLRNYIKFITIVVKYLSNNFSVCVQFQDYIGSGDTLDNLYFSVFA